MLRPIRPDEVKEEIRWLEHTYGKGFLAKSLHADAMRWQALTAPNARERIAAGDILTTDHA